ncbi:MAG: TRAP transporter small permease subunit [Oceanibaculum sp.]
MRLVRTLEVITDAAAILGAILILPLIAAMVFEVLSRYLFSAPTFWAYELGYMMMGAIFMLGIAYALKVRQHVSVDIIHGALPPRGKALVNLAGYAFLLPCVGWLTYALYGYAMRAYVGNELSGQSAWNPVIWPYRVVLFVGFSVFLLQIIVEVAKNIRALVTNDGTGI